MTLETLIGAENLPDDFPKDATEVGIALNKSIKKRQGVDIDGITLRIGQKYFPRIKDLKELGRSIANVEQYSPKYNQIVQDIYDAMNNDYIHFHSRGEFMPKKHIDGKLVGLIGAYGPRSEEEKRIEGYFAQLGL